MVLTNLTTGEAIMKTLDKIPSQTSKKMPGCPEKWNVEIHYLSKSDCVGALSSLGTALLKYFPPKELVRLLKQRQPFLVFTVGVSKDIADTLVKNCGQNPTECRCGHFISVKTVRHS